MNFKILLFIQVGTFLGMCQTFAQEVKWDSTYRPAAYKFELEQFKSFPNSSKEIIFLGNSLTAHTTWNELLSLPEARNRGISGDITFGVLERLDEVIEGKPAKVFILIGINDISRNIPDEVILQNYYRMISRIKKGSPKTKIYLQTLLPTNSSFGKFKNHYNKQGHVLWVNNAIKELGKKEKITVIDLYPAFLDNEQNLRKELTHDGLHLTLAGYQVWAGVLKKGNYLK